MTVSPLGGIRAPLSFSVTSNGRKSCIFTITSSVTVHTCLCLCLGDNQQCDEVDNTKCLFHRRDFDLKVGVTFAKANSPGAGGTCPTCFLRFQVDFPT